MRSPACSDAQLLGRLQKVSARAALERDAFGAGAIAHLLETRAGQRSSKPVRIAAR
jgi:hypothetical protein